MGKNDISIRLQNEQIHLKKDVCNTQIDLWKNGLSAANFLDGFSSGNVLIKKGMAGVGLISGLYRNSIANTFNEQLSKYVNQNYL